MSLILTLLAIAAGLIAGHALTSAQLWHARRALRAAHYDATHDDLTGLPNRRALHAHLAAARRRGQPIALAMLDLNGFKTVNDTLGHDAGDELLIEVAHRLAALPAPVRLAARLQGDEFVLVIDGDTDTGIAAAIAAWRAVATTPAPVGDAFVTVSVSIGVATSRLGITDRQLLHDADLAMYKAKRAGSGVLLHYPDATDAPVPHRPVRRHRDRPRGHEHHGDEHHRDDDRESGDTGHSDPPRS